MIDLDDRVTACCGASVTDLTIVHRPEDKLCYAVDADGNPL